MKAFFGAIILITIAVLGGRMVATHMGDILPRQCQMKFDNGVNCWQDGYRVIAWRQDSELGPRLAEEQLVLCTEHERVVLAGYARLNKSSSNGIYILRR